MTHIYPAIFHQENNAFWVEFPDLEGCHTYDTTLYGAIKSAREALAGYLTTLIYDGVDIPKPSPLQDIVTEDITSYVTCDIDEGRDMRLIRKSVTIPVWLNEWSKAEGINFSKVLTNALIKEFQDK